MQLMSIYSHLHEYLHSLELSYHPHRDWCRAFPLLIFPGVLVSSGDESLCSRNSYLKFTAFSIRTRLRILSVLFSSVLPVDCVTLNHVWGDRAPLYSTVLIFVCVSIVWADLAGSFIWVIVSLLPEYCISYLFYPFSWLPLNLYISAVFLCHLFCHLFMIFPLSICTRRSYYYWCFVFYSSFSISLYSYMSNLFTLS